MFGPRVPEVSIALEFESQVDGTRMDSRKLMGMWLQSSWQLKFTASWGRMGTLAENSLEHS